MQEASKLWNRYNEIETLLPEGLTDLIEEELAEIDSQREAVERRERKLAKTLEQLATRLSQSR